MRDLFAIPIISALCLSGCALCFIATAFDAVFVLFCYTPIDAGGLSFEVRSFKHPSELHRITLILQTSQIGYALAIAGTSSIIIQLTIFPSLLRKFSHAKLYNFFMLLWPFAFVALPLLHFTISSGSGSTNHHRLALVWIEIVMVMALSRFGCLAYS